MKESVKDRILAIITRKGPGCFDKDAGQIDKWTAEMA